MKCWKMLYSNKLWTKHACLKSITCSKLVKQPVNKRFSKPFDNAYKPVLSNIATVQKPVISCALKIKNTKMKWMKSVCSVNKQKNYPNKGISDKIFSNCGPLNGPYKPIFLQELTMAMPLDLVRRASCHKTSIFK